MIIVIWCCHVCRYMRVSHVMLQTHCNGCMNVAWALSALFWGGSRSTKPCVFPCKVVAAGDERYLLCAAGAAAVGLPFFCRIVAVASSCFGCACACVVTGCFGICGCRSQWNGYMIVVIWCCHVCRYMRVSHVMLQTHCNGCMNVASALSALFWGRSRRTKPCVFPCKVVAGGDERYLLCAAGAAVVRLPFFAAL